MLAFVLALVLGDLGASQADAGWVRAITALGAAAAFFLAGQADRIGRKRLLLITIVGYTAATVLTALSPGLVWLTAAQFGAQVFLGAEWAVAITIVVEEFPRKHRGRVTTDGVETGGVAELALVGNAWRVTAATTGATAPVQGAPFGAGLPGWPIALAVGVILALAALGLLTIVQRRATRA